MGDSHSIATEAAKLIGIAGTVVPKHTARVVCVQFRSTGHTVVSAGSGLYVRYADDSLVLTCWHVIKGLPYVVVPSLKTNTPMGAKPVENGPALYVDHSADLDLAIFKLPPEQTLEDKTYYSLTDSSAVTFDRVSRNFGSLAVMCGAWGKMSDFLQLRKGALFVSTPLYIGGGPIVSATDNEIVVSFNERGQIFKNVADFEQLSGVSATGASRDLSGTSGSGLWVWLDKKWVLAGVLVGPRTAVGDPEIRFRPIWKAREWLSSLGSPSWTALDGGGN